MCPVRCPSPLFPAVLVGTARGGAASLGLGLYLMGALPAVHRASRRPAPWPCRCRARFRRRRMHEPPRPWVSGGSAAAWLVPSLYLGWDDIVSLARWCIFFGTFISMIQIRDPAVVAPPENRAATRLNLALALTTVLYRPVPAAGVPHNPVTPGEGHTQRWCHHRRRRATSGLGGVCAAGWGKGGAGGGGEGRPRDTGGCPTCLFPPPPTHPFRRRRLTCRQSRRRPHHPPALRSPSRCRRGLQRGFTEDRTLHPHPFPPSPPLSAHP